MKVICSKLSWRERIYHGFLTALVEKSGITYMAYWTVSALSGNGWSPVRRKPLPALLETIILSTQWIWTFHLEHFVQDFSFFTFIDKWMRICGYINPRKWKRPDCRFQYCTKKHSRKMDAVIFTYLLTHLALSLTGFDLIKVVSVDKVLLKRCWCMHFVPCC